jgi:proteasome lid subunit RPN8/RPN11
VIVNSRIACQVVARSHHRLSYPVGAGPRDHLRYNRGLMDTDRLILPGRVARSLRAHASESVPAEACGFLAGRAGVVERAVAVHNQDAETGRFQMDPVDLVRAQYEILDAGQDVLAIYHSHPTGPAWPSATDGRQLAESKLPQVIVHAVDEGWEIYGFRWWRGSIQALRVVVQG